MNKRPKLQIPLSSFEVAMQVISLLGIATIFLTLFFSWSDIPDKIPTHFGSSGRADAWGGKGSLLFLPVLVLALYLLLSLIERFPHVYNYLCEITEQNARFQYQNARMLIICLKAEIICLFGYIELMTMQAALHRATGLGTGFLPAFLIVLFGTIGFFIYRMVRYK